jgi:KaiC/GvpD/RAD55 family RecA-like ATPase
LFPENFAVLVVGDPSAGMFEFCCYLAATHLKAGERLVFVESNTSAMRVRDQLRAFGVDAVEHEDREMLAIVDLHASSPGPAENDQKSIHVTDLSNLEEIMERVEEGIVKVGGQPVIVLFDSITPLYMYHDSSEVGKFFSAMASMAKVSGKMTSTIHQGIVPDEQIAILSTIADGILEMRVDDGFHRFVRIKHFKGLKVAPKWVPFDIESEDEGDAAVLKWRSR